MVLIGLSTALLSKKKHGSVFQAEAATATSSTWSWLLPVRWGRAMGFCRGEHGISGGFKPHEQYTGWFLRIPRSWIIRIPNILGSIIVNRGFEYCSHSCDIFLGIMLGKQLVKLDSKHQRKCSKSLVWATRGGFMKGLPPVFGAGMGVKHNYSCYSCAYLKFTQFWCTKKKRSTRNSH